MNFWANNFTCNHSLLSPQICCSTTSAVPEPNSIKKTISVLSFHHPTAGFHWKLQPTDSIDITGSRVFEEGVEFGWPIGGQWAPNGDLSPIWSRILDVLVDLNFIIIFHLRNCVCHFFWVSNKNLGFTNSFHKILQNPTSPMFRIRRSNLNSPFADLGRLVFWHTSPSQETWRDRLLGAWVGVVGGMKHVGFQEDCYNHKKMIPEDSRKVSKINF